MPFNNSNFVYNGAGYTLVNGCGDENVVVPSTWNGTNGLLPVTQIGEEAFFECQSLKSITLPGSIVYIGAVAFDSCTGLFNIDIPAATTGIGLNAFVSCNNLTGINISPFNSYLLSVSGVVFSRPPEVLKIFPPGITGDYTIQNNISSIGRFAFITSNLTNINLPSTITSDNSLFALQLNSIQNINVDSNNNVIKSISGVVFSKNGNQLKIFPGGRTGYYNMPYGVTSIGDDAFFATRIVGIDIPQTVQKIGGNAFFISQLENVSIPNSIIKIGDGAFSLSTSLKSVTIPDIITTGFKNGIFGSCYNLAEVTLSNKMTEIPASMFFGCTGLQQIVLPPKLEIIRSNAFNNTTIKNFIIPPTVKYLEQYAFGATNFVNLNSVDFYFIGKNFPNTETRYVFEYLNTFVTFHIYSSIINFPTDLEVSLPSVNKILFIDTPTIKGLETFGFPFYNSPGKISIKKENSGSGKISLNKN
jgi:hypothetical protein